MHVFKCSTYDFHIESTEFSFDMLECNEEIITIGTIHSHVPHDIHWGSSHKHLWHPAYSLVYHMFLCCHFFLLLQNE